MRTNKLSTIPHTFQPKAYRGIHSALKQVTAKKVQHHLVLDFFAVNFPMRIGGVLQYSFLYDKMIINQS